MIYKYTENNLSSWQLWIISHAVIQFTDGKLTQYTNKGIPHSVCTNVFHKKAYKPKIENQPWYGDLTDKLKESKNKIKAAEPEKMIYKMHKEGLIERDIAKESIRRLKNESS